MGRERTLEKINYVVCLCVLLIFFVESFSYEIYYFYGHLDTLKYNFFMVISELVKLSAILILPLAIYKKNPSARAMAKFILPLFAMLSLFFINSYVNQDMDFIKNDGLSFEQINTLNKINLFINKDLVRVLFVLKSVLIVVSSGLLYFYSDTNVCDLKSLWYYPIYILLVLPLNLFENISRHFNQSTKNGLMFSNFSIYHFAFLILVLVMTYIAYRILRKLAREKQEYYLLLLCIVMFIHFLSKNSLVVGDGYSKYTNFTASIPLFICDIGKYVILLALITKKDIFYKIAYFVHAAGAISVFVYLGKDATSDFKLVCDYSFLYFTISHLLLFMLCVLPRFLGFFDFKFKDSFRPIIYYGIVIVIATITSNIISNFSFKLGFTEVIYPNYAFTQISPIEADLPQFMNIKIGYVNVDFLYLIILYAVYIAIFYTVYVVFGFVSRRIEYQKINLSSSKECN